MSPDVPDASTSTAPDRFGWVRGIARVLLGAFLIFTGTTHLVAPEPFRAQVPPWFPAPELTILVSGLIEIALGLALLTVRRRRAWVGWIVAGFLLAVFPGNISQFVTGSDAFGLDTARERAIRLLFQPVLIAWALWCTGAWASWRADRAARRPPELRDTPR